MLKNHHLHIRRIFLAGILLCLFQFFVLPTNAQYDTTIIEQAAPDSIATEDEYTEDEEDDTKEYFEYKDDFDSLVILQRNIPDSVTRRMQEDDAFWYANTEIEKKKEAEKNKKTYKPLGQQTWVKTLIWIIIIGGFAAAIMWYLADSNVGLFRKKVRVEKTADEEIETEDIFAINYQKEIDKATALANYRLAVRLMFLRLLRNMSEKNVINYKIDKTNFDYLLELHYTKYYKDFFRITRNYEYTWYGQFEVNEEAFRVIRTDFDQFEKTLSRS